MITASVSRSVTANGRSFDSEISVDAENASMAEPDMAAAHAATVTSYTNGTAVTLTATEGAGHGILAGDLLSVIWYEDGVMKHRRLAVAGAVAGAAIPISGGSGDPVPAVYAGITFAVMKMDSEAMVVTGNNVVFLGAAATDSAMVVVFADNANAELASVVLDTGDSYSWISGEGITSPLAGDAVAKVFMGHGDTENGASHNTALLLHN